MTDGYAVDVEQIRRHAARLDAIRGRFAAVRSASAHISGDARAYGKLCGWISQVLAGRHQKQNDLVGEVAENLSMAASSLRESADAYATNDTAAADTLAKIGEELGKINRALEDIGRRSGVAR
ncbi:type VII secretion target [Actinokineospora globicatena]|uniref:type VII secretion target n=1 Tax=Actinokineospora globicatena TaxID=103729 RepID=UPI0020A49CA7|nr:type VII secretion target [Actinokineospora globicatena]MCP2303943.1 Excreted virulence factor EspC, type VII ESX diderm [Actinokineospora globicatena]GLW78895.1 hypothetical protein Aglo01_33770 [Actinokineospora globicatena]GLW86692.1 hypothetical protein Aglo02_43310 [Actinokineospora globicatena]